MLIHDQLDKIAEELEIPQDIHPYLHINSREAWVDTMVGLIEGKHIKAHPKIIKVFADNWEELLCRRYSNLN
jgi:hypothetical protein